MSQVSIQSMAIYLLFWYGNMTLSGANYFFFPEYSQVDKQFAAIFRKTGACPVLYFFNPTTVPTIWIFTSDLQTRIISK